MTSVVRYSPATWKFEADRFTVNGTHSFDVTSYEVRTAGHFEQLVIDRMAPLIWLGMPVHDVPLVNTIPDGNERPPTQASVLDRADGGDG